MATKKIKKTKKITSTAFLSRGDTYTDFWGDEKHYYYVFTSRFRTAELKLCEQGSRRFGLHRLPLTNKKTKVEITIKVVD